MERTKEIDVEEEDGEWYVYIDEERHGPIDENSLLSLATKINMSFLADSELPENSGDSERESLTDAEVERELREI